MGEADPRTLPTWVVEWDKYEYTENYGRAGGVLNTGHVNPASRENVEQGLKDLFEWVNREWPGA